MTNLQGAISELVAVIGAVNGVHHAPDEPGEQVSAWPAAMTYATDGISRNEPPDTVKSLHSVQVAVIMPLNDMRQATRAMLPLYETITAALYTHRNGRTSAHYDTFGEISYTLGPIDWPQGQVMYGYVFTIPAIKIRNTI